MATTTTPVRLAPSSRSEGEPGRVRATVRGALQSQELVILLIGVALFVYFTVRSTHFAGYQNISTSLTEYIAPYLLLAVAEVPILILGEIDLSVGEVFVLSPFLVHYLADSGTTIVGAVLITIVICSLIGLINGIVTVKLTIPSFITTLGSALAIEGVVLITANGQQITPNGAAGETVSALIKVLGGSNWAELLWGFALAIVFWVLLRKTTFGLHNVAVGGNQLAASEAGIKVDRVKIWCFVLCAAVGSFAGILDGYHTGSLDPSQDGFQFMFYAVAAAVIGGTALTGGRGTIIGAAIGAIVLGILQDGFNIVGVSAYKVDLILGLAIIAAMILNVQLQAARTGRRGVVGRMRERSRNGGGGAAP
jgi:simple sugar transport system permease protein